MKFFLKIYLMLFFTAVCAWQTIHASPPTGYYLVWSDEFNSTSLDTSKWDYWLQGHRRDAVNTPAAVSLDGSNLVITTYTSAGTHYTAFVATDKTFRSRYGYWEARIQWSDTNGMWSAFWMQSPTMGAHLHDPQTSGSEIDMAEHRYVDKTTNNIANQVQVNLHWNGYGPATKSSGSGNVGDQLANGFHTYGFLWTPHSYSFRIDGNQIYNGGHAPVSHSTEWVALSSEVDDTSTKWAGTIPSNGYGTLSNSATKLTVDYVRYYAPANMLFWTGADSVYWSNPGNWISNLTPAPVSALSFSQLSGDHLSSALGQEFSVHGLVFLNVNHDASVNGTNRLTLGAGGIDMEAADHNVSINCPVNLAANQTWFVGRNIPDQTLALNGNISGPATLTKTGNGSLRLNGSNSFSGGLTVAAGTLGGNGTILGPVTIQAGGTLSPGISIGALTIHDSLSLAGNTRIEINAVAHANDIVRGLANVTYGGSLTVTNLAGTLVAGDHFKIFDTLNHNGNFTTLTLPPLAANLTWQFDPASGVLSVRQSDSGAQPTN